MKRICLIALLFSLLFINCNKDDDDNLMNFDASWQPFIGEDQLDALWLFYTDETGLVVESKEVQVGQPISFSGEVDRLDLTSLKKVRRFFMEEDVLVEREVYELRTYLNVPSDFDINEVQDTSTSTVAIAIEGVAELDKLIWPENSTTTFQFPIFQNTAEDILSFEVPLRTNQPAYFTVIANGESTPRYIWIDELVEEDYTFNYTSLPILQSPIEVSLPNDAFWVYNVYGISNSGQAKLSAPSMPALETEQFTLSLPDASDVSTLRVQANDISNTADGQSYAQNILDKVVTTMPQSIPAIGNSMALLRNEDVFELNVNDESVDIIELSTPLLTSAEGIKLDWKIYGHPEAFVQFRWPKWPEVFINDRIDLIRVANESVVFFTAKKYDSQILYDDYLNAQAAGDYLWEAEQGLEGSTRPF
jgi:hypothetical protein